MSFQVGSDVSPYVVASTRQVLWGVGILPGLAPPLVRGGGPSDG